MKTSRYKIFIASSIDNIVFEYTAKDFTDAVNRAKTFLHPDYEYENMGEGAISAQLFRKEDEKSLEIKTKEYFICSHCGQPILEDQRAFIVSGNICNANPNEMRSRGGIIGNNFGTGEDNYNTLIKESAYHDDCLFSVLDRKKSRVKKRTTPFDKPAALDEL